MKKATLIALTLFYVLNVFAPEISERKKEDLEDSHRDLEDRLYREQELNSFLTALGASESGGDYTEWNEIMCIGKYQFSYATRKSVGYGHIKSHEFILRPEIWSPEDQEIAIRRLVASNLLRLAETISEHEGDLINGIEISKSGILAGAHIGGVQGVSNYFNKGNNPADLFGTSIEDYIIRFSGYSF